jgi:hypothetical protein
MEYTLSLALVDFLPVAFTAIGLYYIVRMVAHINTMQGRVALVGLVLTVGGGLCKALWKLFMATSNGTFDIRWMDDGLFAWMAPGYTLLAWSVWQTVRSVQGKKPFHSWLPPFILFESFFALATYYYFATPGPAWERVMLALMVLSTVVTCALLIAFGFRQKLPLAGWLFIVNLVGIFLLNGLARIDEQTIALQWIEQSINTVSWLAFAYAASMIYQYTRENFGVDASIAPKAVPA